MKPRRRSELILSEIEATGESFLVDPATERASVLNEMATVVWLLCDGHRDARAIADEIVSGMPSAEVDAGSVIVDVEAVLFVDDVVFVDVEAVVFVDDVEAVVFVEDEVFVDVVRGCVVLGTQPMPTQGVEVVVGLRVGSTSQKEHTKARGWRSASSPSTAFPIFPES